MSRYRTDDHNDLIDRFKELDRRLSILERTPQTFRAGINSGAVTFQGGSISFLEPEDGGAIAVGIPTSVDGEEGAIAITITRSDTVDTDQEIFGTGVPSTGADMLTLRTKEGHTIDKVSTFEYYDKNGDVVFSDTANARRGISHPRLTYPWNTPTFSSTTSATFAEIANTEWWIYHPHLLIRVLVQNDVGTTSELLVVDETTGAPASILTRSVASGAFWYEHLLIARSLVSNGNAPNGNSALLRIQHRRVSGAGTARSRVASITGMDLSLTDPY